MVYLFNLWNFFQHTELVCEFDVTMANMPRMKEGTAEWVGDCLSALGVNSSAHAWKVKAFRGNYFSDYPDDDDWRDLWPEGWTVRVTLDGKIPVENKLFPMPSHISMSDTTWDGEFKDPQHNSTALLISDHYSSLAEVTQLAHEIVTMAEVGEGFAGKSSLSIRSFEDERHQLRITFEGIAFPSFVNTLDELLEFCRHQGGLVNWRESVA